MLKRRIIPTLLWNQVGLVKGVAFDAWRTIGTLLPAVKVFCMRDVDELMLLDIIATATKSEIKYHELELIAEVCRVPLAVGGGIRTVDQVRNTLLSGADKVVVNSVCYEHPDLITKIADQFGRQVIIVSIDVRKDSDGAYRCYSNCGKKCTPYQLSYWCKEVQKRGAGEVFIQSIDKDGTMKGYDLEMLDIVLQNVNIPVIISGGCSGYSDMLSAFNLGASAVAASAIFQFTEATPKEAKDFLGVNSISVRK